MKKNKFIVINTWNGDGYSYLNGDDSQIFTTLSEAEIYAKKLFNQYTSEWTNGLPKVNGDVFKHVDGTNKLLRLWTYELLDYDGGSVQIYEMANDIECIRIETNINYVTLFTLEEYKSFLFDCLMNPLLITDEHLNKESNGDIFIGAFEDYDYQFRLIKNIQHNK